MQESVVQNPGVGSRSTFASIPNSNLWVEDLLQRDASFNAESLGSSNGNHPNAYYSALLRPKPARFNRRRRGPVVSPMDSLVAKPLQGVPSIPDPAYDDRPSRYVSYPSRDLMRPNKRYQPSGYPTPDHAPRPWDCFRYNKQGELDPVQQYSAAEIERFLFQHPLHYARDPKTSDLQILIQSNPAQARHRYPTNFSHRCRFVHCPHPTINQGHYQVAFDEGHHPDPYIATAYVHLWCLERFCDLPRILKELNADPDRRILKCEPQQRNPMRVALEKTDIRTSLEERVVLDFIEKCRSNSLGSDYPRYDQPSRPHEGTLTHLLSLTKLEHEPKSIRRQREHRVNAAGYQGSTLTMHLGDLEIESYQRHKTRLHRNQNQLTAQPLRKRTYHQEQDEDEEEGEEEEFHVWEEEQARRAEQSQLSPYSSVAGTKRPRDEDLEMPQQQQQKRQMLSSYRTEQGLQPLIGYQTDCETSLPAIEF